MNEINLTAGAPRRSSGDRVHINSRRAVVVDVNHRSCTVTIAWRTRWYHRMWWRVQDVARVALLWWESVQAEMRAAQDWAP